MKNCSNCHSQLHPESKFCHHCGQQVSDEGGYPRMRSEEHRMITMIFSDVTGYTSMSEILEPEEVKEILRQIFAEISRITTKYEGRIHERIGDCAVVVFGDPVTREDDAIRALKAVSEFHEAVSNLSTPELEKKLGRKLSLHSGVNSGSVLVGTEELRGNTMILGDAVNTAARLDSIAGADDIIVSKSTYQLSRNRFRFQKLDPQQLKGKTNALDCFRLLRGQAGPSATNTEVRRSRFVGRSEELRSLDACLQDLSQGKPLLVTVHAEAGGGKSRFIQTWKDRLDIQKYQCHEGYAYAISQKNIYALWADFFGRLQVSNDGPSDLFDNPDINPHLSKIMNLPREEIDLLDASHVKQMLFEHLLDMLEELARERIPIIILEDIHWADSLSIELLSMLLAKINAPIAFICIHRSHFKLDLEEDFKENLIYHKDIRLKPLSDRDEEKMLQSLLNTANVPESLTVYVKDKISGNPFYLEEFVNNLIESGKLVKNGKWKLTDDFINGELPHTIEGVIRSRIDRLTHETKMLVQQASVIGRSFYYEILKRIADSRIEVTEHINTLQSSDIIHQAKDTPEIEYMFKHALLQEVTYQTLLREDRKRIHQKAAIIIEEMFSHRILDFYEILAYHYSKAELTEKAIYYLRLAGQKSLKALGAKEADQYYQEAYDILIKNPGPTFERDILELVIDWGFAFYHLAKFRSLLSLLQKHYAVAIKCEDDKLKAWYFGWLSMAQQFMMEGGDKSREYIDKAIEYAQRSKDDKVLAYAYAWASSNCLMTGRIKLGEECGKYAMELSQRFPEDYYLLAKSKYGYAVCLALRGSMYEAVSVVQSCIDTGRDVRSPRMQSLGLVGKGLIRQGTNNQRDAEILLSQGAATAPDPLYAALGFAIQSLSLSLLEEKHQMMEAIFKAKSVQLKGEVPMTEDLMELAEATLIIKEGEVKKGLKRIYTALESLEKEGFWILAMRIYTLLALNQLNALKGKEKLPLGKLISGFPTNISILLSMKRKTKHAIERIIEISQEQECYYTECMGRFWLGEYFELSRNKPEARKQYEMAIDLMKPADMPDELELAEEALTRLS